MTPVEQTLPPHDHEAEENVLGVVLLPHGSTTVLDRLQDRLRPDDFDRPSHRTIWAASVELHHAGTPVEPGILIDHLRRTQRLDDAGGRERIHELVALVPSATNVDYYAGILRARRRDRDALTIGDSLRAAAFNGGLDAHPEILENVQRLQDEHDEGGRTFTLESHQELLDTVLQPSPAFLVDDLVEPGILMTIAGVPETHKSWLAFQISAGVAAGHGEILGRQVQDQGAVGYVWQDDSTRNEIERIQLYAARHNHPPGLPIHWLLNQGVTLPRDIPRLRATITEHGLVLLVLDSLYNLIGGIDLKDQEVGQIFATLKKELCDPTGCTVLIVDHMAWATDTNRARFHSYGDVFKTAAIRAGIYIDAKDKKLFIEARGNNIKGFTRASAYWADEQLELRLVEAEHLDGSDYEERIRTAFADSVWRNTGDAIAAVEGRDEAIRPALERMVEAGEMVKRGGRELGFDPRGVYWNLSRFDTQDSLDLDPEDPSQP